MILETVVKQDSPFLRCAAAQDRLFVYRPGRQDLNISSASMVGPTWFVTYVGFRIRETGTYPAGIYPVYWSSLGTFYQKKTVFLQDLGVAKLQLLCPLPVSVEIGDSFAAVFNADLDELAVEETEGDALDELKGSIAESYYLLKNERANLGPLQQRHWNFLQRIIREV